MSPLDQLNSHLTKNARIASRFSLSVRGDDRTMAEVCADTHLTPAALVKIYREAVERNESDLEVLLRQHWQFSGKARSESRDGVLGSVFLTRRARLRFRAAWQLMMDERNANRRAAA